MGCYSNKMKVQKQIDFVVFLKNMVVLNFVSCYTMCMEFIGNIETIIFRNEENGYTVVVVESEDEQITAVGRFPDIHEGERVKLTGFEVQNHKYGKQFNCDNVEILKPNTSESIVRYLSSGLIKGIGPRMAERIVEHFGKKTLDVIELEPMRLVEVKGISERIALEIKESYSKIKVMQEAIMYLQENNISTNLAIKIYKIYGDQTINVVKENPYKLIEDVDGVGFVRADKIAFSLGIEKDSPFRLRAGIVHCLNENSDKNGNTYANKGELLNEVSRLLEIDLNSAYETLNNVLIGLQMDGVVRPITLDGTEIIVLSKYYNIEKSIAEKISRMIALSEDTDFDVDGDIDSFERMNKISLHEEQRNAVKMAVNKGVCVITGGPGTGKTTIIKCVINLLSSMNKKVKLLAPTGRAAKRLSESTGEEGSTIHRALEADNSNGVSQFKYNEYNKLPFNAIIVDEVSMVDVVLLNHLLKALSVGCKLILVGDKDQLPSVGAGNVLSDLLLCGKVPFTNLTKIFRQDDTSLIVSNAHLINEGKMPTIDNSSKDFFFDAKLNPEDISSDIIGLVTTRIPNHFGFETSRVQVLAPLKAGVTGVENLNKQLQQAINPSSLYKKEITHGDTIFRFGDKVMHISNNYNLEWIKDDGVVIESGAGVFNGDIGTITMVNTHSRELEVLFEDGRLAKYTYGDLNQLVLSYAITIHKSQGSEFDAVIIPMVSGTPYILTRNLLYTAVTRAKKLVVLVGSKENLARMVKNNYTAKRYTLLKTFIQNNFDKPTL